MLYREFGCDAVLCRPGTFSPFGHATLHSACRACPDDTDGVMGRISCTGVDFVHGDLDGDGILSAREVLRMLYIDLIGRFWGSIFQPWADVSVNECDLAGITCNRDGKINKIDLTNANLCSDGERRPGPIRYCKGLPSELGTLSNSLEVLQTNTCQFLRGSIPTELGLLSKLQILDMTGCSSLTGKIPTELGQLSKLRFLFLSHCRLHGSLPSQIFNLPSLAKLHVTNNLLTGTLPPSIGNLKDLRELMISRNGLNGSIPKEIGGAIELENIEAYHNDLEQSIPTEIGQCSNLKRMGMSCETRPDLFAKL